MALEVTGSLFFYNRVEKIADEKDPKIETEKVFRDFINLGSGNVLRGIQVADNLLIVILNDGREEKFEIPVVVKGRQEMQTQRRFMQTQIPIEGLGEVQSFYKKYDV